MWLWRHNITENEIYHRTQAFGVRGCLLDSHAIFHVHHIANMSQYIMYAPLQLTMTTTEWIWPLLVQPWHWQHFCSRGCDQLQKGDCVSHIAVITTYRSYSSVFMTNDILSGSKKILFFLGGGGGLHYSSGLPYKHLLLTQSLYRMPGSKREEGLGHGRRLG